MGIVGGSAGRRGNERRGRRRVRRRLRPGRGRRAAARPPLVRDQPRGRADAAAAARPGGGRSGGAGGGPRRGLRLGAGPAGADEPDPVRARPSLLGGRGRRRRSLRPRRPPGRSFHRRRARAPRAAPDRGRLVRPASPLGPDPADSDRRRRGLLGRLARPRTGAASDRPQRAAAALRPPAHPDRRRGRGRPARGAEAPAPPRMGPAPRGLRRRLPPADPPRAGRGARAREPAPARRPPLRPPRRARHRGVLPGEPRRARPDGARRPGPRRARRPRAPAVRCDRAALLLVLTAPLFAWIAWRITRDSPGPVFFRQVRLGEGQRPFTLLKFRTMAVSAGEAPHREYVRQIMHPSASPNGNGLYKLDRRADVTPFGAWLRRTSLDELPQLVNVLRGEMSLVGPRPCLAYETELYEPHHFDRFLVPAGMTGLWQVTARARVTLKEALDLDAAYARSWSLGLDLWLLARTPLALLRGGSTT